jgi:hypothetical protein
MAPLRGYAAAKARKAASFLHLLKTLAISSIDPAFEPTGHSSGLPWRLSNAQFRAISVT